MAVMQGETNLNSLPLKVSFAWPAGTAANTPPFPVLVVDASSQTPDVPLLNCTTVDGPPPSRRERAASQTAQPHHEEYDAVAERALLGLAAEQTRRLAVLLLNGAKDRIPSLAIAQEHLLHIEIVKPSMHLEDKAKAAARAYTSVSTADHDDDAKCLCGHCLGCLKKSASIPVRDTLLLYCLAICGHRQRKTCLATLQAALGTDLTTVVQSQLLNAHKHLMDDIPGSFRSVNSSSKRMRRPKGDHP